ncbi:protein of unknown function [Brochothrix thermosphacta]|nr:hypothetical protein FM106_11875 [Brachybacterium faecium]SPN72057.1 protein of unknown function [Brochothrix thermosphacta]
MTVSNNGSMPNSVVIQNLVRKVFFASCLFLIIANIVADSSALRE